MSACFLWLSLAMASAAEHRAEECSEGECSVGTRQLLQVHLKDNSADKLAYLSDSTAGTAADLFADESRALLTRRRRKGKGVKDPAKELKKVFKELKKVTKVVKKAGGEVKNIGKDMKKGIGELSSQLKKIGKAIPSPKKLGPMLQKALEHAVKQLVPLAEQIPGAIEKLAKQFLGNGCLKKMLSNFVELPPEPYKLFEKKWNHSNILVQVDHYMPELCIGFEKISLDVSGLGSFFKEIPKKAMKDMKPMFMKLADSVEEEVIEPISKIIKKIEKKLTKGPKKLFEKIKKALDKFKKMFDKVSLLQLAEAVLENHVNGSSARSEEEGEGLEFSEVQHEDDKEEQQDDEEDNHENQEQEEEHESPSAEDGKEEQQEDEEDNYENQEQEEEDESPSASLLQNQEQEDDEEDSHELQVLEEEEGRPSASLLQDLQKSMAEGSSPINLKELSISVQLIFTPNVTLDFGASFSQEGDILGLIAEKLEIPNEPWNQRFETRADLVPGALWIKVAASMELAWPYAMMAEARARASFQYTFKPKLLISFKNGKFSLDLKDLKGRTDLDASVYGWASVATKASAKVKVSVQICTQGICFDKTTSVFQSVEAGADIYAAASTSGGFVGSGFLPYAALRSAADFQWKAYPEDAVNKCRKAMPGLCTGLWLNVPQPRVDIALGILLVKKMHVFKKFKNLAGKGALVTGLFPGTKLWTLGFKSRGKKTKSHGEEAEAVKQPVVVETEEEDCPVNITNITNITEGANTTSKISEGANKSKITA